MKDIIMLGRVTASNSDKIHQNQEVLSVKGISMTVKSTAYKGQAKILRKFHSEGKRWEKTQA